MDKIAFIGGSSVVYWNSIVLTLAAATAICFFLAFYIGKCGNAVAAFAVVPAALVLSIVCARFFHWYCRADSYVSFQSAMTDYSSGFSSSASSSSGLTKSKEAYSLIWLYQSTIFFMWET